VQDRIEIAQAQRGLGTVAFESKNLAESKKWFQQSLATLGTDFQVDMAYDIRARMALVEAESGNFDEALATLQQCLTHWKSRNHPRWIAVTLFQIGSTYQRRGDQVHGDALLARARAGFLEVGDMDGVARCDARLKIVAKEKS
jgi:tetratricopeptide (TPR) repeat protein